MPTVHLTRNPLDPEAWQSFHAVRDVLALLLEQFNGQRPPTLRIYHGQICKPNDVTPHKLSLDDDIQRLLGLPADAVVHAVVWPGSAVGDVYNKVHDVSSSVIGDTLTDIWMLGPIQWQLNKVNDFLFGKDKPRVAARVPGSPNQALGQRGNTARLGGRIPDNYGLNKLYPDLIQVPYRTFERTIERTTLYMCLGRGSYDYTADDVKDGDTKFASVPGARATFYGPGTSRNSGVAELVIGDSVVGAPLVNIYRVSEVSGIQLKAPNDLFLPTLGEFYGDRRVATARAVAPDIIELGMLATGAPADTDKTFDDFARDPGQEVNAVPFKVPGLDLSGVYTLAEIIDSYRIRLDNPAAVNPNWSSIVVQTAYIGNSRARTPGTSEFYLRFDGWQGPFTIDMPELQEVWFNFIAPRGLWATDGKNNFAMSLEIQMELTPVDEDALPVGAPQVFTEEVFGNANSSNGLGFTFKVAPTVVGRQKVRVRISAEYIGNTADRYNTATTTERITTNRTAELNWVDCYGVEIVTTPSFGNVTTAHVELVSNSVARGVKDKRFNVEATRKIRTWTGAALSAGISASRKIDEIFISVAEDTYIGRLGNMGTPVHAGIVSALAQVRGTIDGLGGDSAGNIDFTLDNDNFSAEDTLQMIAQSGFSVVDRLGSDVRLRPDLRAFSSVMVLNHRNVIAGSETRQDAFYTHPDYGTSDTNDGVEVDYLDDRYNVQTFRFPLNGNAINPRNVEKVGLSSYAQAFYHGMREMQHIRHQHTTVQLTATHDVSPLAVADRVIIADSTRPPNNPAQRSGDVLEVSGLTLRLSQATDLTGVQTIYLQHTDFTVEAIPGTPGINNTFTLSAPPSLPLVTDINAGRRTRYMQDVDISRRAKKFIVTEKQGADKFRFKLSAVNYTDLYYLYDNCVFFYQANVIAPLHLDHGPYKDYNTNTTPPLVKGQPNVLGTPTTGFDADRRDFVYVGNSVGASGLRFIQDPVAALPTSSEYTILAWIKYDPAFGANQTIVRTYNSGSFNEIELYVHGATGQLRGAHGGTDYVSFVLPDDDWHLVSLSWDGSSMWLFLDGVFKDLQNTVPGYAAGDIFLAAGLSTGANGSLHMVRIFNRFLSADENYDAFRTERIVL